MKNKVLILGAGGMVGRVVFMYLSSFYPELTYGTVKKKGDSKLVKFNFPKDNKNFEKFLSENNFSFIINCIGMLKAKHHKDYSINLLLPKFIDKMSKKYKFNAIQISTDDVFSADSGKVTEKNTPNPNNPYGKSKLKGEIHSENIINIRTSFLGFDPENGKGLVEWLVRNRNKAVDGYVNQIWNGCTTLQFAKFCNQLISKNKFKQLRKKTPVLHFAPLKPISKYELLKSISNILKLNVKIKKYKSEETTRYLSSIYLEKKLFNSYATKTDQAISELRDFEK